MSSGSSGGPGPAGGSSEKVRGGKEALKEIVRKLRKEAAVIDDEQHIEFERQFADHDPYDELGWDKYAAFIRIQETKKRKMLINYREELKKANKDIPVDTDS